MTGGVSAIDRELADYKIVASDLKVGVNHLALDEERIRQEQFFEGILDLQQRIFQNPAYQERYGDEVENLKNGIRLNADVLSYLKSITKLEVPLTDLTNKITQAAIDAGSPKAASPAVFANKALSENVNSCWEYIAQLSLITQTHLKDAASFQQFHHMTNEVDAHIDKMIGLAEMKMALFDPQGTVDESALLAKELEADHVELTRTWEQICQLTDMARYMKPLRNRQSRVVCGRAVDSPGDVAQQIVMVKALIDFSGPDFAIRKGEEMILMNNENPNFWRVKTTFGEREVPSLIFSTIGPNQNEVFTANSLQKKCVSIWKRVLERTKGRLVKYYATLFERYCQNDVVYFAHEDAMNAFLDDVDSILIAPNYDSGILHRAYEKFTNTLMLLSPNRRPPRGALALTESDIRVLHTPLRLLLNQVTHVDQFQARVTMTADEVQRYLKSVEDERQHIYNEIARMEQLQKEKEIQLKSLADRLVDWKGKRRAFDRAIRDHTSEPTSDILKHFPSTRLARPNAIGNDYRSPSDHYETDAYEPSNKNRQSTATPSPDYGQVAKQMVTSHARSKPSGITFVGGVIQESAASKVWAGNAMSLKKSASTNDLQTQILRVTMSTSTQYNENTGMSELNALHDTDVGRQNLPSRNGSSIARVKAELNTKSEKYQSTADVQAQITRVMKNASSQVGVRVMPKAIDLSRVDIDNLGLEVQNTSESTGLGLRVGQVLCPVTVGTSMDLFEGPGVQVMGINDVDSIDLQLRDSLAHATTDAHRRLKVRDVQAQIFSRSNSPATASVREDLLDETRGRGSMRSEVQAQVGIINKAVGVQAVATMEVVNIPSQKPKKRMTEGSTTSLCLLPGKDTKSMGFTASEPSTSTVMTQISCLLHSRGIHSDLESYLFDYKRRNGINSEASDLCTQMQHVGKDTSKEPLPTGFVGNSKMVQGNLNSVDVETLICKVVHDAGTQVSSKLVPTEVTMSRITTRNMEVSLANPLRKIDIGVPIDSLICPADMIFRSELYEGSDFVIADYSGLNDILVTHDGSVARGSITVDEIPFSSRDSQFQTANGLKTQAAIVLRTDETKSAVKEIIAGSICAPKLRLVVTEIAGPSNHATKTPTSDLQTQINSENFDKNMTDFTEGHDTVKSDYSTKYKLKTQTTVTTKNDRNIRVVGEIVCSRCHQKYREIQMQFDSNFEGDNVKRFSSQTQICNVVSDVGTQSQDEKMYGEHTVRQRHPAVTDTAMQVGAELVPTEILMSRCDIENMELEFEDEGDGGAYRVRMKSVACPARIKVKPHLVEGSGVHIVGITDSSEIGFSVCSSTEGGPKRNTELANRIDNGADGELQSFVTFEPPIRTTNLSQKRRSSDKSVQRSLIRLIPSEHEGQIYTSSDTITQVFTITKDASVQVGTQLVPQAIGIAPVRLKNMEVSVTSKSRRKGEETLSASTLLYPAQVELKGRLVDEESGIEVVPLDQVEALSINSPEDDSLIHYTYPPGDLDATAQSVMQIREGKKSGLLPASLLMETGQFDSRRRTPELASQSLICGLLSSTAEHQELTIRAKPVTKMNTEYCSGSSAQQFGYLTVEAVTQNVDIPSQKIPSLNTPHSVEVQVGTRLIPKALKISQLPVKNLKLESVSPFPEGRQSFSLQAARCPAEIITKTELCEDSGIFICSLDQSGEVAVEMSGEPVQPLESSRMVSGEQSSKKVSFISGRWNSSTNKSMQSATIKLPVEGVLANSSNLQSNESSLTLQAEAIFQPENGSSFNHMDPLPVHDLNQQFKLVVVDTGSRSTSRPAIEGVSGPVGDPARDQVGPKGEANFTCTRTKLSDKEIQVGLNLVPKAVTVESIRLENIDVVSERREVGNTGEIGVSAMLCSKPTQYDEILTETQGVTVLPIEAAESIHIAHDGKMHYATVESRKTLSQQGSYTGTHTALGTTSFTGSQTRIRVHHAEFSADSERQSIACTCGKSRSKMKIDGTTQVGATFIPTQLNLQQMRLDSQRVQSLAGSLTTKTVLCPTDLSIVPILNECSGVEIAAVKGVSELSVEMAQGRFAAEVLSDSFSNQMCIAIKEKSISTSREVPSESIPLVEPTARVDYTQETAPLNQRTNSNALEMSSKIVQVGTLLIPTAVVMEKVKVDNLEVEVPLSPARSAEVSVSAVLASSVTEMTSVLTNDSGINVVPMSKVDTIGINVNGESYIGTVDASALMRSIGTFQKPRSIVESSSICSQDMQKVVIPVSTSNVASGASSNVEYLLRQSKDLRQLGEALHCPQNRPSLRKVDSLSVPFYGRPGLLRVSEQSVTPVNGSMTMSSKLPAVGTRDDSVQVGLELVPQTVGPIAKRLVSSASQVGTLLVPTKVCMDRIAVDQLAVDIPLTEWRTTDLSVSAILASTATEMLPVITDTTGIQIIEMKDLDKLGIEVGDKVYVASVVAPPVKCVNTAYGQTRDFCIGAKSNSRKQETVFISVPRANETAHLTHRAKNLLNQSAELEKIHSLLQSSSFQPRLRITSTSGTSVRLAESASDQHLESSKTSECSVYTCPCGRQYGFVDSLCRPITGFQNSSDARKIMDGTSVAATEKSKMQESYHVACEAAIKPEMLSKRLTANICSASNSVGSQFSAAAPTVVPSSDGNAIVPNSTANQQTQHVLKSVGTHDMPVPQVGAHFAITPRDFAVADLSKQESSKGEYATRLIEFENSLPQFTHQRANDMALGTLHETNEATVICQTRKRTHSADSRTQEKVGQLCVNCRNKMLMTETSVTEPYDPNSVQPAITIRRGSDVDLFETSLSTSISRASRFRRSFFSKDPRKCLSGSFESLGSQSLTTKCAMCHTDLTSGDLTTSIRTSTSSLLGSEAVVNMSLKEIAEAYVSLCRVSGQADDFTESRKRASLYLALKHNRIIQAVIADYEKEKSEEGQFFLESKEIVDVVATTIEQTGYCISEPSTYSRLRNNHLVKKVVESYENYKQNQRKDSCTQTDPAQLESITFASSNIREIAEAVGIFEKSEGQVASKGALYAHLKGNPIIQRVIEEYELNKGVHTATIPRSTRVDTVHSATAASKMEVISVDGQVAKLESEKFASTDSLTRNSPLIIRRSQSNAGEKTISSSVSSDSEDEDIIQSWRSTQRSSATSEGHTRFDVACSALITPETWDKKVQFDSTYQH